MHKRFVRNEGSFIARRCAPAMVLLSGLLAVAPLTMAQVDLGPVTIGGGMRTSFVHTEPDKADSTDKFNLDSARLYVNGSITKEIKFMFNTEYDGANNKIGVLDAVARFELNPKFNIWAGRFLPPSDRANLYGPYYANQWGVYTDGIQNGHPFVFQGRDNGVAWWGDFNKVKLSLGAFDGGSATGKSDVIGAGRIQIDFWDKEEGYYLNGTYYGDKNLLALGGATQVQNGHTATTVDFLMEKKLGNGGVVSLESEYSNYSMLGGYDGNYGHSQGAYGLGAYLFPQKVGIGNFQILGKFASAEFTHGGKGNLDYNQKTTEFNVNYVMKQFKARIMTFVRDTRFDKVRPNMMQVGVGLQIQM